MSPAHDPLLPDRVRRIERDGFAFLPNRFLRCGFFASLARDELALYVLLVMAGDRSGMSYYRDDRLCSLLQVSSERLRDTRAALIAMDLVAYDGIRYQVVSLPERPVLPQRQEPSAAEPPRILPMPAAQVSEGPRSVLAHQRELNFSDPPRTTEAPVGMPEQVRHTLRRLFGQWSLLEKP